MENKNAAIDIMSLYAIIWPPDIDWPKAGRDKYAGKGDIQLKLYPLEKQDTELTKAAETLYKAIESQRLDEEKIVSPEKTGQVFQQTKTRLENIWKELSYEPLERGDDCPYELQNTLSAIMPDILRSYFPLYYRVIKRNRDRTITVLDTQTAFPADDRSHTTVNPQATCWLYKKKPVMLSFHWDWECQGSGEETVLLEP